MSATDAPGAAAELRLGRAVFTTSLLLSLGLASWCAAGDARYVVGVVGLGAVLALGLGLSGRLARRGVDPGWLLAVAALNLALLAPELGLRAAGFRYESGIQFGYPRPWQFVAFEPHPQLFWTLRPGSEGVNSWGFPGPEVAAAPPPGTRRILVFGDSCSQSGYPEELGPLLASDGEGDVEVVILAISGYSSHQGRWLAETRAPGLGADLAFVYFGWNDHWRAWGEPDETKVVEPPPTGIGRLFARLAGRSRLLGAGAWLRDGLRGERSRQGDSVRVPPDRYRENLVAIASALEAVGTRVVFLTAPSTYPRFGVPGYVIEAGLARDAASAVALHARYNEIVRDVAALRGAGLVDLEAHFDGLDDRALRTFFREDGIHFRPAGHQHVAELIAPAARG